MGSRDAVLVFRTSILNEEAKETTLEKDVQLENDKNDVSGNESNHDNESTTTTHIIRNDGDMKMKEIVKVAIKPIMKTNNFVVCNIEAGQCGENLKTLPASVSCEYTKKDEMEVNSNVRMKAGENEDINLIVDERFKPIKSHATSNCEVLCINEEKQLGDEMESIAQNTDENQNSVEDMQSSIKDNIADYNRFTAAQGMPATELQITYKFQQTETLLLRRIFTRHGLTEVGDNENYNILWTGVHMKPDILRNLTPYQRVNHFPR